MTTMNLDPTTATEARPTQFFELTKDRVLRASAFVIDRFMQNGDFQMAQSTNTPLFYHESIGFNNTNIVLGEE